MSLFWNPFGAIGSIVSGLSSKKQNGSITGETINYDINIDNKSDLNNLLNSDLFGELDKIKDSEVNFNFNFPSSEDTFNLSDDSSLNLDKNANITSTASDSKEKTSSVFGRAQSEEGEGDLTSKEGINPTMLIIAGAAVLVAIFVLPKLIGGKK